MYAKAIVKPETDHVWTTTTQVIKWHFENIWYRSTEESEHNGEENKESQPKITVQCVFGASCSIFALTCNRVASCRNNFSFCETGKETSRRRESLQNPGKISFSIASRKTEVWNQKQRKYWRKMLLRHRIWELRNISELWERLCKVANRADYFEPKEFDWISSEGVCKYGLKRLQ